MSNFIDYLQRLERENQRQALAALRRGLGKPPGEEPEMHRYVARWLPNREGRWGWEKATYYLVASLFALHPEGGAPPFANMGAHFARIDADKAEPTPATERRFNALLDSHLADLHRTLQPAVSLLKARGVALNWQQLHHDLKEWEDPEQRNEVRRAWAMAFWGAFAKKPPTPETPVATS